MDIKLDKDQSLIFNELREIAHNLNNPKPFWKIFLKNPIKNSIYLYGSVGTGKTMLMQSFYDMLKQRKMIIHYQNFMKSIHENIYRLQMQESKKSHIIATIAKEYAEKTKILCLDEFEIKDITDAMIIGVLLTEFQARGIFLFITSNTKPDNLYKDGLQRASFLPFIGKIHENFQILHLNNHHDYRFDKMMGKHERIIFPQNKTNQIKINEIIAEVSKDNNFSKNHINVLGRELSFEKISKKTLITNFEELFERNLGYADYVNICENFNFIIIENIKIVPPENTDTIIRFINFIDNAYYYKILLFMLLEDSPEKIYQGIQRKNEYKRTISRLCEMNSEAYLQNIFDSNK